MSIFHDYILENITGTVPQDSSTFSNRYCVFVRNTGQGHYGYVQEYKDLKTNERIAIKCIKKSQVENVEMLRREITVLKDMKHPNIIQVFDFYEDDECVYVITEFCRGGQLFDRIGQLSEKDIATIIRCIIDAIAYCHDMKDIIHRDLKPENILFKENSNHLSVKVIDFGLAPHCEQNFDVLKTKEGLPYYTAPEISLGKEYDKCSDLWSIGVITYTLLCGSPPFYAASDQLILESVKSGHLDFSSPIWDDINDAAKDFVYHLLELDPQKR